MNTLQELAEIRYILHYDPLTGNIFRYNEKRPASIAKTPKGPKIFVLGKYRRARSVVWAIMTGAWPEQGKVKCVDGNLYNLKWENFKEAQPGHKICASCKNEKPDAEFPKNPQQRDGKDSYCKLCKLAKVNPEKLKATQERARLRKYRLAAEEHAALLASQNGCCAICKRPENGKKLAIDHCHTSGKVRSLLCTRCNVGLGAFRDSPRILVNAAKYLMAHGKK